MQLEAVDITIRNFSQAWFALLSSEKPEYVFCFLASQVTEDHRGFQWQSEEYKDIVHIWIIVNKVTSAAPMQKKFRVKWKKKCVRVQVMCFRQCYA